MLRRDQLYPMPQGFKPSAPLVRPSARLQNHFGGRQVAEECLDSVTLEFVPQRVSLFGGKPDKRA